MTPCIPPASQGNLFVKAFDLRQQTTGLRRLRQMETKIVSVCLYTEQACSGSPSRHSGSSSALKYSDRYTGTTTIRDQCMVGKPILNPTSFLGVFFFNHMLVMGWFFNHMLVMVCVQACDNLLLLPCGKLVVSLTRLEFLLHTYMHGLFTCVQTLQSWVQTYSRTCETYSFCMH